MDKIASSVVNPHLGTETEAGWAMGFTWGFLGPAVSSEPPLVIAPEQMDAFNEGVLAGQQVAIAGIPIDPACVSLAEPVPPEAEGLMTDFHMFELLGIGVSLFGGHFAHAGAELFFLAFLLMIPGPPDQDPVQVFDHVGNNVRDQLTSFGLDSTSLFFGAAIDEAAAGCELQLTPIFTTLDGARQAAQAIGRAKWVVAEWDAAAPVSGGGFRAVASSAG